MSRAINLSLSRAHAMQRCDTAGIGVSDIEDLPGGGIRLVCMSSDGAAQLREMLAKSLLPED